jgi:hypothetical protein
VKRPQGSGGIFHVAWSGEELLPDGAETVRKKYYHLLTNSDSYATLLV